MEIGSLNDWQSVVFSISFEVLRPSFNFFSDGDLFGIFGLDYFIIF